MTRITNVSLRQDYTHCCHVFCQHISENGPDSEPNQEKQIQVQAEINREPSTPDQKHCQQDCHSEPHKPNSAKTISIIGSYYI